MKTLGETIAARRKALGMTQVELAEKLHISDKTLSRWETGKQIPDALDMLAIADGLQLPVSELYGRETEERDLPDRSESHSRGRIRNCLVAGFLAALLLAGLFLGVQNGKLQSQMAYKAELVPMYQLTASDGALLRWVQDCQTGGEAVYKLSRLRQDPATGEDIACFLLHVPQGGEDTRCRVQYRWFPGVNVLKVQFEDLGTPETGSFYFCYLEVPYDPSVPLRLETSLDGKAVPSGAGIGTGGNWGALFSVEKG